ncbi:FixH family protein [Aureivirga sp. CE67]|uniref:FixH family protein n=1 Tax=Aureivirga sp. CE67 TaxID=1788983 RepID=UPI0018C8F5DE|nr:FixH family protein [Aureivirga sp. CE67]
MKFNWGTGIALALAAFMIFILSFVYRVMFDDKYEHHLVSEDYYKEELYYQNEIDKMNNANSLKEKIQITTTDKGVEIIFPQEFDTNKINGKVSFQRLAEAKLDFELPVKLMSHTLVIPKDKLIEGRYDIKLDWTYDGKEYLLKKKISY